MMDANNIIKVIMIASGDLWAGAEAVVFQLVKGLHETTPIQLDMVILNHGKLSALCMDAGIPTHVLDERRYGFPHLAHKLMIIARHIQPHIIHSHRYKENILAASIAPFVHFPKLVRTLHGISEAKDSMRSRLIHILDTMLMRNYVSRIVAVSDDLRHNLIEQGIPKNRVTRIYNGLKWTEQRSECQRDFGMLTIGSAGRLVPVKDFALLVDIARVVCAKNKNVRFVLAGDGPEMESIRGRLEASGIGERFKLLGHVEDINVFYEMLDIYINTSRHEGIPMTVLEAMRYSLPVIAPAVGGLGEIIEQSSSGYLVSDRSISSFVGAIESFIHTPELIQEMGKKAQKRAMDLFSAAHMVQAYYALYQEILI